MDYFDDLDENSDYTPKKRSEIEIPDFLSKNSMELPTEEQIMQQALLNNVPSNTDIEKQNHLSELERACQNWDSEEWAKIIIHADSHLMFAELDRRIENYEKSINDTRSILNMLSSQKL